MDRDEVRLVAVNVGRPALLGQRRGRPVLSGIVKRPAVGVTLALSALNLDGDGQADLQHHGGPDKAVYAYPTEHLPSWRSELGLDLEPGAFGENLSVAGWLEADVRIGDVWAWGEARLQVAQPRSPCFKLAMRHGRPDLPRRLVASGRSGWYLRVLVPGEVPLDGPIRVVERHPAGLTVRSVNAAGQGGPATADDLSRMLALAPLAAEWRLRLRDRLATGHGAAP